jgi:hypothetical protein
VGPVSSLPLALVAGALALVPIGCGGNGDDGERTVVRTETVTVPAETTATQVPSQGKPPFPGALVPEDNVAVDHSQQAIVEYCQNVGASSQPSEGQRFAKEAGVDALLEIYRRDPDARWVPPARPERDRSMKQVLLEMVEILAMGCSPEDARRLESALRAG